MKSQHEQVGKALTVAFKGEGSKDQRTIVTEALNIRDPLLKSKSVRVFLSASQLQTAQVVDIAFSFVKLVKVDRDRRWRLLELVSGVARLTIRNLVLKMHSFNPSTFGLLNCVGAVDNSESNSFGIVYRLPEDKSNPRTMRESLNNGTPAHSLSNRFRVATQLARAVCSVHNLDMVHKSICPENILLLQDGQSKLGSAFLVGFETVRLDESPTNYTGDADWAKNLYRHPQRQGLRIKDRYVMQHDIYSLGVCLLEIGLWASFVEYDSPQSDPKRSVLFARNNSKDEIGTSLKESLLKMARDKLPEKMGSKYASIVVTCLTCLDEGNEDFSDGSEFLDKDRVLVAMRYIEKILVRFSEISV